MSRFGWRRGACAITLVGLVASACTHGVDGVGEYSSELADVPDANVEINGLPDGKPTEVDILAGNAIADLEDFWAGELPRVYDEEYEPLEGGLYSVDPDDEDSADDLPCGATADDVRNNAFYCPPDDAVAWDRAGLFPTLRDDFGPFLVAMVVAHEWGHAIQGRVGDPGTLTITSETQADCFAGAWTAATQNHHDGWHFIADRAAVDDALAGYLLFRDPAGADPNDPQAHGNGFDRISAFQEGFENGTEHCADFTDDREFTEIPFLNADDAQQGGNLPFDQAIDLGHSDLSKFWATAYPAVFGEEWTDVQGLEGFTGDDDRPECGGDPVNRPILYCADNDTIYYDQSSAFPAVYDKTGDFGPMTLIAVAYGQAVLSRAGKDIGGDSGLMSAICLAGAYAGQASRGQGGGEIQLSPGDLDEAIQVLLSFTGRYFGAPTTAGFNRVTSFRTGFADPANCE